MSEPPAELRLEGVTLSGRYRIESSLGEGGIGVVYQALDTDTGRQVAVKVLRELYGAQRTYRRRFEREARALASLEHPNIVGIVDHGVAEEMPYLVMERLQGETLSEVIARKGPLEWAQAHDWMNQLLAGLEYVHGAGLLHRDLKPGNVFIERKGGEETVRLLDFGLVKFIAAKGAPEQAALTRTGELFGTPGYMPPEQILGQAAGPSADVYSATVVLFEMLAGKRPFHGGLADMARQQLEGVVPTLQQVRPAMRAIDELHAVFQQGLHHDVAQRFQNVAQLRDALDALPDEPLRPFGRAIGANFGTADTVLNQPASSTPATRVAVPKSGNGDAQDASTPHLRTRAPSRGRALLSWLVVLAAVGVFMAALSWRSDEPPPWADVGRVRDLLPELPPLEDVLPGEEEGTDELPDPPAPVASPVEGTEGEPSRSPATPPEVRRPKVPARNPWRGAMPGYMRSLRRKELAGKRADDADVSRLRRHNREHPNDPRGHLLLAGFYLNRDWYHDAITQYEFAVLREPSARGDSRMLRDLLALSGGAAWKEARALIVSTYGAEALPAVRRALRQKPPAPASQRLQALSEELQALP